MAVMRRGLITVLVIALILFVLVFSLNNQQPVSLDFIFFQTPSLGAALWVLIALVVGALLGMVFTSLAILRARVARRRVERQLHKSERALTRERGQAPKGI